MITTRVATFSLPSHYPFCTGSHFDIGPSYNGNSLLSPALFPQGMHDACSRAKRLMGLLDMTYEHLSVEIQDFITDMRGPRPTSASAMSPGPQESPARVSW